MSAQTLTREKAETLARGWFAKVDVLDVDGTMSLFEERTLVTFGNNPGVKGDTELRQMFSSFYSLFDKMHHDIRDISLDLERNTVFIESRVGYYLKANKEESPVVVPAMSVMRFGSARAEGQLKAVDFRVYIDLSPVMAMLVPNIQSKE